MPVALNGIELHQFGHTTFPQDMTLMLCQHCVGACGWFRKCQQQHVFASSGHQAFSVRLKALNAFKVSSLLWLTCHGPLILLL